MVYPSGGGGIRAASPSSSRLSQASAEQTQQLARELVSNGFLPKFQGRHISNHNLAEKLYIARQSLARDLGLSEDVLKNLTPFPTQPGNNTVIYNDQQPLLALFGSLLSELVKKTDGKKTDSVSPTPAPPIPAPAPAPTPAPQPVPADPGPSIPSVVDSVVAGGSKLKWLWPALAALGLAGGSSAWYLWPTTPEQSEVVATFNANIR